MTPKVGDRLWCPWATSDALNFGFGVVPPWEGIVVEAFSNAYLIAPADDVESQAIAPFMVFRDASVTTEYPYDAEGTARDGYVESLAAEVAHLSACLGKEQAELERWEQAKAAGSGRPALKDAEVQMCRIH